MEREVLSNPAFGIEKHFLPAAKREKKEILELETLKFQLEMLKQLKYNNDSFQDTVKKLPTISKAYRDCLVSWKEGDLDKLDKKFLQVMPILYSKDYRKVLYDDRNATMTEKIKGYIDKDESVFVTVGYGHFGGEKGIVPLLRKSGYSLTQLKTA